MTANTTAGLSVGTGLIRRIANDCVGVAVTVAAVIVVKTASAVKTKRKTVFVSPAYALDGRTKTDD